MDIEEIKTLTDLMVDHDLSEIMIRDGEKRIVLRRGDPGSRQGAQPASASPPAVAVPAAPAPEDAAAAAAQEEEEKLAKIASPMVGTFYAASDPDSPPYVKIGDTVNADTVVCIIEAMKVFNEIKAEISGTIESIEVKSGDAVEFGQAIMKVRVD